MEPQKILVTLMCEDRLYDVLLPEKVHGRYWIEDMDIETTDPRRRLLSIEGENGAWKIFAGRRLKLFADAQDTLLSYLELEVGRRYAIELSKGRKAYIFTEAYTMDRCTFKKYCLGSNITLNIGKNNNNHIVIDNPYVSSVHAQLSLAGDMWTVYDNNSKNGIYVNKRRLYHSATLRPGDVLYILGVKIVLGNRFLAINNPDGCVNPNTDVLKPYIPEPIMAYEPPEEIKDKTYYRSPRLYREIVPLELKIDAPTSKEKEDDTPIMLALAPSLVMGSASLSSGIVAVTTAVNSGGNITSVIPTMVMSVAMLTGMVIFPFITKKRDKKKKKTRELERREKYLKYLSNIKAEIYRASVKQQEILNVNYPPVKSQMSKKGFYETSLWSRVIGQKNFLTLRVGAGNIPLQAHLTFPDQRFSIDDDIMREEVKRFSETKHIISDVPVVYSLVEHRASGIVGNGHLVNEILNNLIVQIAALHSYDEVKIVFLCDESNLTKFDYVKWMPHIWDDDFRTRFLAVSPEEIRSLSAYFLREMEKYRGENPLKSPHYVIVSTSKALSDGCTFLSEMLRDDSLQCFSYLAAYDELKNLPKECSMIIQVSETQGMMFNYRDGTDTQVNFIPDTMSQKETRDAMMDVAEYRLDLQGGKYNLPELLTFLDMFKVGKYEHLNITSRWRESNPVASLQAPVGVNSDGELFYLDLHEEAHGPHGLVAGMTGSGKSEFIITYILSMAVNYSPEDVAFILIDYKGGGLVGAFESDQYRLPHLAGTITNLDGSAITRSLLSIQSELKRRQRVFAEARRVANEGTMDIYKYQKLFRNGIVVEPVPHLIIISDEFAELKSQQPEFMEQLISTARIGRSLGVHLILATQKPSGVVSDQIWANSKFKVSLKVQDRADSMEMLKRPEAVELVETGRFYLQVGYNELFELGQSAWCGAPYISTDVSEKEVDERVQLIDHQGNVLEEAKPIKKAVDSGNARKQIVEIVQYLTKIAEEEQLKAKPLWMPEMPARITLECLEQKYQYQKSYALNPIIGEVDDPFNQDQRLLTIPFAEKGNVICYGNASSGKEELLITLLCSLYRSHMSDEVNTYILDFGAETLQIFADAPQTGGVAVSGEDEKISNLFKMIQTEMTRRRKKFVSSGGDYLSYRRGGGSDIPAMVVIINEYANFAEQYEMFDDIMSSLTRDCTKYGIYFVVTNISQVGIRYKLQQNFSQVFILQMNDKSDYTAILGNTGGVYPSKITGRGIYRDKDVYEFQTACVTENVDQIMDKIADFCQELKRSDTGQAKEILVIPKAVGRRHLGDITATFENIPIGLNANTAEPVCIDLTQNGVEQVFAMDKRDTEAFIEGMAEIFKSIQGCELYVIDPDGTLYIDGLDGMQYEPGKPEELIGGLFRLTVSRHNAYKTAQGGLYDNMSKYPIIVVLMGLSKINRMLSDDGRDKLRLMLEKNSGNFGISFWVIDDYLSSNAYSSEKWCNGEGIWVGGGIGNQKRFRVSRNNIAHMDKSDFTYGCLIRKSGARVIKLLLSERFAGDTEEEYGEG